MRTLYSGHQPTLFCAVLWQGGRNRLQLPLAQLAGGDSTIEFVRLVARHAERLPVIACEVLGQQHNLPHMMRVVRQLAVDGLHDGMRFATNGDGAGKVCIGKRLDGVEDTGPASLPTLPVNGCASRADRRIRCRDSGSASRRLWSGSPSSGSACCRPCVSR